MLQRFHLAGGTLVLAGFGCAGTVPVETVVSPSFSFATVEAVAVLPLFEWSLSIRNADTLATTVAATVRARMPVVRVVFPAEASRLIAADGMAYDWALFLHDWEEGEELDRTAVMRVADLLGVDLLLVVDLPEVFRHDGAGQDRWPYTVVVARLRGFGGATGLLAWSGSAGLELSDLRLRGNRAPPVIEAAQPALRAVLQKLPQLGAGQ